MLSSSSLLLWLLFFFLVPGQYIPGSTSTRTIAFAWTIAVILGPKKRPPDLGPDPGVRTARLYLGVDASQRDRENEFTLA